MNDKHSDIVFGEWEFGKFYHKDWCIYDLLQARKDGLLIDGGEAWRYDLTANDGVGGKYDLLYRRNCSAKVIVPRQKDSKNGG